MKTIYIAGGGEKNTAIRVLTNHLTGYGHRVTRAPKDHDGWDVTLRWGKSYKGDKPAINAHVNQFDKFEAMLLWHKEELSTPTVFPLIPYGPQRIICPFPWLARKRQHLKGKDIVVCNNLEEVRATVGTHDFISVYVRTKTEYRIWVFKGLAFAAYEKLFKGEGEYKGIQRNRRFGFRFENQEDLLSDKPLCKLAVAAVATLNMDFGGVDILKGKDGKNYLLEVNSMPHIDSEKRVTGIRLAKLVSKWAEGA